MIQLSKLKMWVHKINQDLSQLVFLTIILLRTGPLVTLRFYHRSFLLWILIPFRLDSMIEWFPVPSSSDTSVGATTGTSSGTENQEINLVRTFLVLLNARSWVSSKINLFVSFLHKWSVCKCKNSIWSPALKLNSLIETDVNSSEFIQFLVKILQTKNGIKLTFI